jgi:hypothetical protein
VIICCERILGLVEDIYNICVLITVVMVMLLRDFGPYENMCIVITVCHSNALMVFWTFWDNIYDFVHP